MIATSVWDGIDRAEIFDRGRYVTPNFQGVIAIKKTISKDTRNKGMSFIVEFEVVETNMPDEHPIGSKLSWFQKMSNDNALGNVLAWAACCVGIYPQDRQRIDSFVRPKIKEAMHMACQNEDNNLFTNKLLYLVATPTTMRNGQPFTRYDFSPYNGPHSPAAYVPPQQPQYAPQQPAYAPPPPQQSYPQQPAYAPPPQPPQPQYAPPQPQQYAPQEPAYAPPPQQPQQYAPQSGYAPPAQAAPQQAWPQQPPPAQGGWPSSSPQQGWPQR